MPATTTTTPSTSQIAAWAAGTSTATTTTTATRPPRSSPSPSTTAAMDSPPSPRPEQTKSRLSRIKSDGRQPPDRLRQPRLARPFSPLRPNYADRPDDAESLHSRRMESSSSPSSSSQCHSPFEAPASRVASPSSARLRPVVGRASTDLASRAGTGIVDGELFGGASCSVGVPITPKTPTGLRGLSHKVSQTFKLPSRTSVGSNHQLSSLIVAAEPGQPRPSLATVASDDSYLGVMHPGGWRSATDLGFRPQAGTAIPVVPIMWSEPSSVRSDRGPAGLLGGLGNLLKKKKSTATLRQSSSSGVSTTSKLAGESKEVKRKHSKGVLGLLSSSDKTTGAEIPSLPSTPSLSAEFQIREERARWARLQQEALMDAQQSASGRYGIPSSAFRNVARRGVGSQSELAVPTHITTSSNHRFEIVDSTTAFIPSFARHSHQQQSHLVQNFSSTSLLSSSVPSGRRKGSVSTDASRFSTDVSALSNASRCSMSQSISGNSSMLSSVDTYEDDIHISKPHFYQSKPPLTTSTSGGASHNSVAMSPKQGLPPVPTIPNHCYPGPIVAQEELLRSMSSASGSTSSHHHSSKPQSYGTGQATQGQGVSTLSRPSTQGSQHSSNYVTNLSPPPRKSTRQRVNSIKSSKPILDGGSFVATKTPVRSATSDCVNFSDSGKARRPVTRSVRSVSLGASVRRPRLTSLVPSTSSSSSLSRRSVTSPTRSCSIATLSSIQNGQPKYDGDDDDQHTLFLGISLNPPPPLTVEGSLVLSRCSSASSIYSVSDSTVPQLPPPTTTCQRLPPSSSSSSSSAVSVKTRPNDLKSSGGGGSELKRQEKFKQLLSLSDQARGGTLKVSLSPTQVS